MSVTAAAAMSAAEVMNAVGAGQGAMTFAEWMAEQAIAATTAAGASGAPVAFGKMYNDLLLLEETFGTEAAEAAFAQWTAKTATGAASQSPVTKTAVKTAIKKAGSSGASVAGLLSMSLPAWVAAAAPVLGVAAGYGLYKLNPELWEKISRTLLPFCYKDTSVMPACVDENGQTYLDKDALDALKRLFEEEGIGGDKKATSQRVTNPVEFSNIVRYESINAGANARNVVIWESSDPIYAQWYDSGSTKVLYASSANAEFGSLAATRTTYTYDLTTGEFRSRTTENIYYGRNTVTYDDKTARYVGIGQFRTDTGTYTGPAITQEDVGDASWTVVYGNVSGGTFPEGTEKWSGDSVDYNTLPESERYTDITDSTKKAKIVPVALPIDPMVSNDGSLFPSATTNADPDAAIAPYITPDTTKQTGGDSQKDEDGKELDRVAPLPFPIPSDTSQTNPRLNPSQPSEKYPPTSIVDILPNIFTSSGANDKSPLPTSDAIFSSVAGLISVYNPTPAELIAFSRWLWVTYQDATIDKIWNNPFDGVISLHEIYVTPTTGAAMYIRSGFLVSDVSALTVPVRYVEINCGTVVVPEYWNNYLDYSPYTKVFCYLPFIGIVSLEADDIIGHAVNITYRIDVYSGACIALIECARTDYSNQLYQFSGNCSVEVPIAGGSQAAIKAGQIMASAQEHAATSSGIAGLIGGIGSGLLGALAGNIGSLGSIFSSAANAYSQKLQGEVSAIQSTVTAKSNVQHSGTFGESFGALGNKTPYLIIKRPQQVVVTNYHQIYGYPAHKFVVIGNCTGFLRVREVHVISATACDEEKAKIESMLKTGVYVTE